MPKNFTVYLIDDDPHPYLSKLNDLHQSGRYQNIIIKAPKIPIANLADGIVEKIKEISKLKKKPAAVMLDNLFCPSVWLSGLISNNYKQVKEYIKTIIDKKVKIIIFTNQNQPGSKREELIKELYKIDPRVKTYSVNKSNADDDTWINELMNILKEEH